MKIRKYIICSLLILLAMLFVPQSGLKAQAARKKLSGWMKIQQDTYYFTASGKMAKGWKNIAGKRYYFARTGELVTSSWVGTSYVDKKGCMVRNKTVQQRKIDRNGKIKTLSPKDTMIVVGASRMEDMSIAVNRKDTVFIAKGGQDYDWLINSATAQLQKYLKQNPKCSVVFQLGHNDVDNVDLFIDYYQNFIKKYPKASVYFMDITPGDNNRKNKKDLRFNEQMKAAFGDKCIGGYDYLMSVGYETVDGTHYIPETSRLLYRYIRRKVNGTVYSPSFS